MSALILGPALPAASAPDESEPDPRAQVQRQMREGLDEGKYVTKTVPIGHSISLEAVRKVSEAHTSAAILGFRFEQDTIVGEVFISDEYTFDDFAANFESDYGTQPEITGLVTVDGADNAASATSGLLPGSVMSAA